MTTETFEPAPLEGMFRNARLSDAVAADEPIAQPEKVVETPVQEPAKTEPEAAPAVTTEPPAADTQEKWDYAAYKSEKAKRQERDAELATLRAELEALKAPKETPKLDIFDPEYPDKIDQRFEQVNNKFQEVELNSRIETSRVAMRGQHKDFDEVEAIYLEEVRKGLVPKIPYDHQAPAQYAYDIGSRLKLLREIEDPKAYREKVRSEIEDDLKAKADEARAALEAQIMPTTAGDRNAAPRDAAESFSGPTPLDQMFKSRHFKQRRS